MEYLKKLYTKYISVNLKDYIGGNVDIPINKILIFIALGLCVACVFINYNQSIISRLLKKLIRLDAFSEESSKTLKDLGLADHSFTKRLILKNSGAIKKVLGVVGRKTMTYEEYIAFEKKKKEAKKARLTKNSSSDTPDANGGSNTDSKAASATTAPDCEIDFSTARFYVIPDMREYAEHAVKRDSSPIKTALYCVVIVAFFLVLIIAMPTLLNSLRGMF